MKIEPEELIALIREHWGIVYERGRLLHLHRNHVPLQDGRFIHLRVMVQEVLPPDNIRDDLEDN